MFLTQIYIYIYIRFSSTSTIMIYLSQKFSQIEILYKFYIENYFIFFIY